MSESTTLSRSEQTRLVEKFMPFAKNTAVKVAKKLPIDPDDAIQVAYEGLVNCAQRFNPEKHDPLQSPIDNYFKAYIYPRISGAVIDQARRDTFAKRRGLEKGIKFRMDSLDATREGEDGNDMPVIDLASITGDPDLKIDFERAMLKLTDKERHVIMSLAVGGRGWEIAEELGVTESRISQISTEARKKLLAAMLDPASEEELAAL